MKTLIKLVLVLVVLVIGGLLAVWFYIDTIAKSAIEKGSSSALKVNTSVSSASLSILHGQLVLGGLDVSNPSGFKTKHFLDMKTGDVAVSLGSLTGDVVEVGHILLSDIDMNLEKKDGKANYQVILDNLKGSETETKPASSEGKRFIVKELSIKNVKVHLLGLTPIGGDMDVPIDEIKLQNVGSDSNKGLLLKDLSGVIVKALFKAIVDKGGGLIPADLAGELAKGLSQLTDLSKLADIKQLGDIAGKITKPLEGIGKGAGDVGKDLGKGVEEIGDKVKEGLGGILGGKKDKKDKKDKP